MKIQNKILGQFLVVLCITNTTNISTKRPIYMTCMFINNFTLRRHQPWVIIKHTGMESKWESLFPSLRSNFELSSSAKMLAMVWSSSVSWKLLLKLELELALALIWLSSILPQLKQMANTTLQSMSK